MYELSFDPDLVLLAQRSRAALPLIAILFGVFQYLSGIGAIIAAAIFTSDSKESDAEGFGAIVAFIAGCWTAFCWFGLPFSINLLFGLVGCAIFGVGGLIAFFAISGMLKPAK